MRYFYPKMRGIVNYMKMQISPRGDVLIACNIITVPTPIIVHPRRLRVWVNNIYLINRLLDYSKSLRHNNAYRRHKTTKLTSRNRQFHGSRILTSLLLSEAKDIIHYEGGSIKLRH